MAHAWPGLSPGTIGKLVSNKRYRRLQPGRWAVVPHSVLKKFDDTFTVQNWYESEQMKMNYEYMAKWFTEGYIRMDAGSLEKIDVDFSRDGLDGYILNMQQ
ncbi:MAG: hypothetical protein ACLR23_04245 [Clostridia bacterium]